MEASRSILDPPDTESRGKTAPVKTSPASGPAPASSSESGASLEKRLQPLYQAWRRNDTPETRRAFLREAKPLIDRAIYTYTGRASYPTIRGEARLLMLDALQSYDPNKGSFSNHAMSRLQRLHRRAAKTDQIISIPEQVVIDRKRLTQAEEEFTAEYGRVPSVAELADRTGLSPKRISYVQRAAPGAPVSSFRDAEGNPYSPAATIPGQDPVRKLWQETVYYELDGIDQAIMDHTMGLHGREKLSNQALAKKLGLTPGAVSQRKRKIQQRLDAQYQDTFFGQE